LPDVHDNTETVTHVAIHYNNQLTGIKITPVVGRSGQLSLQ